jgi:hypothetical protein
MSGSFIGCASNKSEAAGAMGHARNSSALASQGSILTSERTIIEQAGGQAIEPVDLGPKKFSTLVVHTLNWLPCSGVEVHPDGYLAGFAPMSLAAPEGFPQNGEVLLKSLGIGKGGVVTGYEIAGGEGTAEEGEWPDACMMVGTIRDGQIVFISCRRTSCTAPDVCLMGWRAVPGTENGFYYCECTVMD